MQQMSQQQQAIEDAEAFTPSPGDGWGGVRDSVPKLLSLLRCSVCQSEVKNPASLISCGHFFCHDCIMPWLADQSSCPECSLPALPKHVQRDDRVRHRPPPCPHTGRPTPYSSAFHRSLSLSACGWGFGRL